MTVEAKRVPANHCKQQQGRREEEEREVEEGGGEQVEEDVTGWTEVTRKKRRKTVQMFVKVNGSKATPMEVTTKSKMCEIDEDVYVTMHGRMLKKSERLKSCGVTNGCAIQVSSRVRGGGKHKGKKSKVEKKQVTRQEPVRNEGPAVKGRWRQRSSAEHEDDGG